MERRTVNPWSWQERVGFEQAVETSGDQRILWCAGQTAVDADGNVVPGGMAEQIAKALDNLEEVLAGAGLGLGNVVRVTWYVTSIEEFRKAVHVRTRRFEEAGCRAASTLVEISRLAMPELLVEVTATAVA